MKKYVFIIVALICYTNAYSQNVSEKQTLQERIEHRDTFMDKVKKGLVDTLKLQISDYYQLTKLMADEFAVLSAENQNLRNELHQFHVLTSSDTLIFNWDFKIISDIPLCLQERVNIVNSIIELKTRIVVVENTAQELERILGDSPTAYAAIREKIEKDLELIQALIHKIKEMNLLLLSDEQQKFFRPGLTDRYNNFEKYF